MSASARHPASDEILHLDETRVRDVYGAAVFLLRPDLHIAWRGDGAPADPVGLAEMVTGRERAGSAAGGH